MPSDVPPKLPTGRLSRLARMASLGARTGVSLLTSKDGAGAAARTAEVLGTLRGLAAKVGQMASYVDGVVPDAHRDAYEASLTALRAKALSSPFPAVKELLEQELGAPLEQVFARFDEVPFASASIGQVHLGRLLDGREVAVKVQHPGIAEAVEADLGSARMLEPLAALAGGRKADSKRVLFELESRFREELDYALEAERQERFRVIHAGDPHIHIPAVVLEHSSKRVLVSDLAHGVSLEEAACTSEPERRAFAQTLWRFVFKGNLVGGMFNADPHPGNYLFGEQGHVTFLDFGCVEPILPERLENARGLHRAALDKDEETFARYAAKILHTSEGTTWGKLAIGYSRLCFTPLFSSPFKITRPFAAELVGRLKMIAKSVRSLPNGEVAPLPPGMLFMNRLQFGFYSVLARLDVEVDYAGIERAFMAEAGLL